MPPALYPPAAVAWMVGDTRARVLDLGAGSGTFAQLLHDAGHEVFAVDRRREAVAAVASRLGTRLHVAARAESLPFLSCHFDIVTASQALHRFAPGLALTEIARVLRPGGHLAVAYNTRDDTVPWVRRLMALVQASDPGAMSGSYGVESIDALADSPYFRNLQRRNFRNWIPITRRGLVTMVRRRPATARLDGDVRDQLLAAVGHVYDTVARPPDPLLLPYQAACWRADVDHDQLSLADDADAVEIAL